MNYEHNELCNLADRLKSSFFRRKSAKTGKPYKPHINFSKKEVWLKAAGNCKELKADAEDFLDAAFRYSTVANGPFPNQLGGDAMKSWYAEHAKTLKKEDGTLLIDVRVDLEIKTAVKACFLRQERNKEDPIKILNSSIMDIPPYVRIILLNNSLESMVKYGEAVHKYMLVSPGLRDAVEKKGLNLKLMYECIERRNKK
jgi:hypothetical protein